MNTLDFDYFAPADLPAALEALQAPGSRVIAGGTDLVIALKEGRRACARLVDVSSIPALGEIRVTEDAVVIGAAVPFAHIAAHPVVRAELTALAQAAGSVGSPQIRNRGTIGGNLATGSAAGDSIGPVTAFGGWVTLAGPEGQRRVPIGELWSPEAQTGLSERTILTQVAFPRSRPAPDSVFVKLGRREALAISRLSLTLALWRDETGRVLDARAAVGSAGKHAYRAPEAEALLTGRPLAQADAAAIQEALACAVRRALGSRATTKYKAQAVKSLALTAIRSLL